MDPDLLDGGVVPRPRRDWSNFNADLLRQICLLMVCRADRARMSAVCRNWRGAITELPRLLRSPPVLYFPNAVGPSACCTWCDGHRVHFEEAGVVGSFFASHDGGWMALRIDDEPYLYNLGMRHWIPLPLDMTFQASSEDAVPVTIKMACFSGSPFAHDCIGAALVGVPLPRISEIMFWRVQDLSLTGWGSHEQPLDILRDYAVDVLCCQGRFYFLTDTDQVIIVDPHLETAEEEGILHPHIQILWFANVNAPDDDQPDQNYILESRGEILLVHRYQGEGGGTVWFRVFTLDIHDLVEDTPLHKWVEIFNLDGRLLYMSRGSSRCYESADFPDLSEGVYFKGDIDWISHGDMALDADERFLIASDSGVWSGELPGGMIRCFKVPQQMPVAMIYSEPAWVLPGHA